VVKNSAATQHIKQQYNQTNVCNHCLKQKKL
jgi:hypothetical protein